jgi:hypothetical protein
MATTNSDFFNPYFDPSLWSGQTPSLYEALVSAVEQWALPALPRNLIRRGWVPRAALPAGTRDYAIVSILNRARQGTNTKQYTAPTDPADPYGTITELTLRVATCQVDFYSESEAGFMRADSLVTFVRGTQGASWFRQWSIGSLYCDDVQQMDYTDGEKYQVMQSTVTLRLAYWSGLTSKLQFFDDVKVLGVNPDIVLDKQNL